MGSGVWSKHWRWLLDWTLTRILISRKTKVAGCYFAAPNAHREIRQADRQLWMNGKHLIGIPVISNGIAAFSLQTHSFDDSQQLNGMEIRNTTIASIWQTTKWILISISEIIANSMEYATIWIMTNSQRVQLTHSDRRFSTFSTHFGLGILRFFHFQFASERPNVKQTNNAFAKCESSCKSKSINARVFVLTLVRMMPMMTTTSMPMLIMNDQTR